MGSITTRALARAGVAGVAIVTMLAIAGSALALDLGRSVGRKFKVGDACTMLKDKELQKAFGQPVTAKDYYLGTAACSYTIGADQAVAPGGRFTIYQLYPTDFQAANARFVFEDNHATESLSDEELHDIDNVGVDAYLNVTRNKVVVLGTKKFTFELTWQQPSPAGEPLTEDEIKAMTALAKKVVARAKR